MAERVAVPGWVPPSAFQRKRILDDTRSIAIVGASANPSRASNFVAIYLLSTAKAYTLYLVNPRETEILGQPVYPSLQDLPEVPDMVDVFSRGEDLPPIAQEAVKLGSKTFWAQLGLWSAEAAGLDVVMDRCTKIEHARFAGGLHLAGFNTGVITARR